MVADLMLDGVPLRVNPSDIRWNFTMKTVDSKTLDGKVVQVLGTRMGDITIRGTFGRGRTDLGDRESWEGLLRFREQVDKWAEDTRGTSNAKSTGLRLTYAPHNWDFLVFVKNLSIPEQTIDSINLPWELTLFPADERAWKVVQTVKDLYIKRLMDGIGWRQTEMNGPTQDEVTQVLNGRSVDQYLAERMGEVYEQGTQGQPYVPPGEEQP